MVIRWRVAGTRYARRAISVVDRALTSIIDQSVVTRLHASSPYLRRRHTTQSGLLPTNSLLRYLAHICCLDLLPTPLTYARPSHLPSFVPPSTVPYLNLRPSHIQPLRWRQGRRSFSRYCSSGRFMQFPANARRSLSSETAGSARPA
jgi:hypothetical protein